MSIRKNVLLNWYVFFNEKKMRKMPMIFEIENWLWKSNFGAFWQLAVNPKIFLIMYPPFENSTTRIAILSSVLSQRVTAHLDSDYILTMAQRLKNLSKKIWENMRHFFIQTYVPRTHVIKSWGLYIDYPIFEDNCFQECFFRKFCLHVKGQLISEWLGCLHLNQ